MDQTARLEPLGIYVHWPFCKAKCPYCDFNSHVRYQPVGQQGFVAAMARELDWFASLSAGRTVESIFFGGGTPSLMAPEQVAAVIEAVAERWPLATDAEITLEANPTSIEAANFTGYRAAGINRVSVGVQSLNDADLKFLGRQHSADEAIAAYRLAARIFPRTSFDLIYARPGQTVASWREELGRALLEQQGHMSIYQLTIEPGTAFAGLAERGLLRTPDDDSAVDLWEVTQEMTAQAGLAAYEVSNHAAAGHECRHNLNYWRCGDYAGAGPGAHSRLTPGDGSRRLALAAERHPETWRQRIEEDGTAFVEREEIEAGDEAREMLLMGLRLSEGISLERWRRLAGGDLPAERLEMLQGEGLIAIDAASQRLAATARGRQVLNSVIAELAG